MACYYGDTHGLTFLFSMQMRFDWRETLQIGPFNKPDKCPSLWLLTWEEFRSSGNHSLHTLSAESLWFSVQWEHSTYSTINDQDVFWARPSTFFQRGLHTILSYQKEWNGKTATRLNDTSFYCTIAISGIVTWGWFPPFCTTAQRTCEWVLPDKYTCVPFKTSTVKNGQTRP